MQDALCRRESICISEGLVFAGGAAANASPTRSVSAIARNLRQRAQPSRKEVRNAEEKQKRKDRESRHCRVCEQASEYDSYGNPDGAKQETSEEIERRFYD